MALEKLQPGDLCILAVPNATPEKPDAVIKYRYVVAEALPLPKRRNEKLLVPCFRPIKRKKVACNLDRPDDRVMPPKIKWIERSKLRKLPA